MQSARVPEISLNSGAKMPQLGLGVWQIADGEPVERAVGAALEAGYRLIDTASAYGNERGVGRAIRQSGLPRDELFITTKLWNSDQGHDSALAAFEASLERLGLDYVDLYLIHWPSPDRGLTLDSWRALEELYHRGLARSIGVSNFTERHLKELMPAFSVTPAVNQIELHPAFQQRPTRRFCKKLGIQVESWSPLMRGDLDLPLLQSLAVRYGKTPAQVVLRWHIQSGLVAIPKSENPERIRQNIDIFNFALDPEDMKKIGALDSGRRLGPDPDQFN